MKNTSVSILLKYVVSYASAEEIDRKGIAVCIKACAQSIVEKLNSEKDTTKVLLDGGLSVSPDFIQETFIKGDENYTEELKCIGCFWYDPIAFRQSLEIKNS